MRAPFAVSVVAVLALATGTARAEGLLRQLPEDGSWVRFDFEAKRDGAETGEKGSLTISSVGRMSQGNEDYRWIEYKVTTSSRTILLKLLVSEKYLKSGDSPLGHAQKGWLKFANGNTRELNLPIGGELLVILSWYFPGPLEGTKKLEKELVASKFGELECEGISGRTTVLENFHYNYDVRLHKKAPFGVVSCHSDMELKRDGKVQWTQSTTLKLADFGNEAESALPGYQ
jgi:hypothetical protein